MALPIRSFSALIANGASISDAIETNLWVPVALVIPAGFQGTFITFQANMGSGFIDVHDDDGDESAVVVGPSRLVGLSTKRSGLEAIRWADAIKIRAGLSGAPTNQNQQVTVKMLLKELYLV